MYLDLVGTIPPTDVATSFVASTDPDKRKKVVEMLLASAEYSEHWRNYWDDVLMGRNVKSPIVDRVAFRYWLRARFLANSPWDRIVRDLVAATGQNSIGGARVRVPQAMSVPLGSQLPKQSNEGPADLDAINGAVNWTLRFEGTPQDLAGNASRVFLGVQIQCAQCHDHKTEKWKQDDFRRFASASLHPKVEPIDRGKTMGDTKRVEVTDLDKVWMGDFGRTPTINGNEGRDHHPVAWTAVLSGGGIRGGIVHGETDAQGDKVVKDAVTVPNLLATVATTLGLDPADMAQSPAGRPIALTDGGAPVKALLV